MKRLLLTAVALGLLLAWRTSADEVQHVRHLPACPPGHVIAEEICYKEVCREVCRMVPDVRKVKKWVYSCIDDPFCIQESGHKLCGHKHCEPNCPHCKGPLHRKLLVKREVVVDEVCDTKCVVEKIVEKVPYKVYHTLPCGSPIPPGATVVSPAPALTPPLVAPNVETLTNPPKMLPKKL